MLRMLRSAAAVVAGFVLASIVMTIVEFINGHLIYPELGRAAQGVTDRDAIRQLFASAPAGAFLVVLFGWALGSVAGGLVAAWIGRRAPVGHALVLGGLLVLAGISNNLMLPPPVWFWISGLVVLLPAAYAGGRLAPATAP